MKRKRVFVVLALAAILTALTMGHSGLRNTIPTVAQTSANHNLEWHVIGGGGQPVASASFVVNSTTGQGAASPPYLSGSTYVVSGGYWFVPHFPAYLPVVLKNH